MKYDVNKSALGALCGIAAMFVVMA